MATLTVKEKAAIRSEFYDAIDEIILNDTDLATTSEPIATGILFHTANGAAVEVRVIVKDETKFSLEEARLAYQDKLDKAAARAAKHAEVEAAKAAKAAEKLAKTKAEEVPAEEAPVV